MEKTKDKLYPHYQLGEEVYYVTERDGQALLLKFEIREIFKRNSHPPAILCNGKHQDDIGTTAVEAIKIYVDRKLKECKELVEALLKENFGYFDGEATKKEYMTLQNIITTIKQCEEGVFSGKLREVKKNGK